MRMHGFFVFHVKKHSVNMNNNVSFLNVKMCRSLLPWSPLILDSYPEFKFNPHGSSREKLLLSFFEL